jgi:hypothetical protein
MWIYIILFWHDAVFGQLAAIKNINSNTLSDYVDPPTFNISSGQSNSRFAMQKSPDSPVHYWCSVDGKMVKRGKCKYSSFIKETENK